MRKIGLIFVLGLIVAVALAVSMSGWAQRGSPRASAQDEGPITLAIDMDPTGNACTGPATSGETCTIATIDQCVSVSVAQGTTFSVDTFTTDLYNGYAGFNWDFAFPDSTSGAMLTVTAQIEGDAAVNLVMQSQGSQLFALSESVPDPPGDVGTPGSPHTSAVADFGTNEDPTWTRGTLIRYTFEVGEGASPGVYGFSFVPGTYALTDQFEAAYPLPYTVWDNSSTPQFGVLALGVPCPPLPTLSPTPTATPSPTPTATPSTSVTPTPTGTPSPGNVSLVAGWNDSCYQGQAQDIDDAFASVSATVQAVYRMKPDQGFDRWFPARADLSTITTLGPFDQLFILAGSNATWTVQPLAELPSSAALNAGWNSVCYLGGGNDAAAATAGISDAFSIIYSLPPDQVWLRYIPGQPDASTLVRLETFTSVLILMSEPRTWAFTP